MVTLVGVAGRVYSAGHSIWYFAESWGLWIFDGTIVSAMVTLVGVAGRVYSAGHSIWYFAESWGLWILEGTIVSAMVTLVGVAGRVYLVRHYISCLPVSCLPVADRGSVRCRTTPPSSRVVWFCLRFLDLGGMSTGC
jgi:hypothetical protein